MFEQDLPIGDRKVYYFTQPLRKAVELLCGKLQELSADSILVVMSAIRELWQNKDDPETKTEIEQTLCEILEPRLVGNLVTGSAKPNQSWLRKQASLEDRCPSVSAGHPEVVYAIGIEHRPDEIGMIDGPTPDLESMLHTVGQTNACLLQLSDKEKFKILYRWSTESLTWVAV